MAKNIVFWVWAVALTLAVGVGVIRSASFGDALVSLTPTQYQYGINIGPNGPKVNTINSVYSGSFTIGTFILAPYTGATSTTSTAIQFTNIGHTQNGLTVAVGDTCIAGLTTAPSSTPFGIDVNIVGVSTTAQTASATVTFWNGNSANNTITTGTLAVTCFNTPF